MVILVIDQHDIRAFKLEGEAPVLVYPNRPVTSKVPFKRVQSPYGNRHIVRAACYVELRKLQLQPLGVLRLNTGLGARSEELLKPSVAKRADHEEKCIARLYRTQAEVDGRLRMRKCVTDFSPLS